jgi:hypothetical protein
MKRVAVNPISNVIILVVLFIIIVGTVVSMVKDSKKGYLISNEDKARFIISSILFVIMSFNF